MSILSKMDYFVEHDICHTKIGLGVMTFLRKTRISRNVRKMLVFRMMDSGIYLFSDELKDAKVFFAQNQNRVEKICSWLSDEESRDTYRRAIEFRCSLKRHNLPKYYSEDQQYFDKIVKLSDREVFIDCGAYIGDTVDQFRKIVHNKYKRIVCFEPDYQNYEMLLKKKIEKLIAFNAGVWSENSELAFVSDNATSSKVLTDTENNIEKVRVCAIDMIQECSDASFIKMDVEGSEFPALQGAKKTILHNTPKLAICIYHSNEDMLRIAEYIHDLVPDYKLYIRHYSYEAYETVLYAIKD